LLPDVQSDNLRAKTLLRPSLLPTHVNKSAALLQFIQDPGSPAQTSFKQIWAATVPDHVPSYYVYSKVQRKHLYTNIDILNNEFGNIFK
jgi:hypothetical protein